MADSNVYSEAEKKTSKNIVNEVVPHILQVIEQAEITQGRTWTNRIRMNHAIKEAEEAVAHLTNLLNRDLGINIENGTSGKWVKFCDKFSPAVMIYDALYSKYSAETKYAKDNVPIAFTDMQRYSNNLCEDLSIRNVIALLELENYIRPAPEISP